MAGALSHAEVVDRVVRQSVLLDELRPVIAQQQARITPLAARVRDLEQQLAQRDRDDPTKRLPGLQPAATPRRKSGPHHKRTHGFRRPLTPQPTEVVQHAAAQCPHGQTPLASVYTRARWRKAVLDLPPLQPAQVIHHVYLERTCPSGGRRVERC